MQMFRSSFNAADVPNSSSADLLPSLAKDVAAVQRIEAVQKILQLICRTTGLGFSAVARVTDARWVACAVRDEIGFGLKPGGELDVATTICHEIRGSGEAVAIDDVAADGVYCGHPTPAKYGFRSYVSVPVRHSDGRFFGTLCAIDPKPAKVNTPETLDMFRLFAELIAAHLDADELQAADRALHDESAERLDRLNSVIASATDYAVVSIDPAGRIDGWSSGAQGVFGWTEAEVLGQPFDMIWTPEDIAGGRPAHELDVAKAKDFCPDNRYHVRSDGHRIYVVGVCRPVRNARGKLAGFVKVCRDETERHEQSETQGFLSRLNDATRSEPDPKKIIATVEQMLGEYMSVSRVLIAEASADGTVVTIPQVWALPGMPLLTAVHRLADYGERILSDYRSAGLHIRRDAVAENPPGPERDALVAIGAVAGVDVAVMTGGVLRALLAVHQSTARNWTLAEIDLVRQVADRTVAEIERARANRVLREGEQRFRALVTASSDVLYRQNPNWSAILHLAGNQFISDTDTPDPNWFSKYIPTDEQPRVRAAIDEAIQNKTVFELEHRVIQADGSIGWTFSRAVPLFDEDGQIVEWFGAASDTTQRHRVEEQREKLLDSERVARAEAEQAGRMKDEFLATLSHELRTPLNAIMGWTEILRSTPGISPDFEEGLAVIARNARAQTQIIEDILDMSRIINGKLRLDVQRVDLAAVVKAGADTVQPAADAKQIRLQLLVDPRAGLITGDPSRLHQVVWNLISNAVKFTPKGGRVQVLLERVNSHVEVSVIDTGEGIEPAFVAHAFDRFRQADASTTRRHGGLGLGLAIVKQIVEMHGGSVRVKSPGKGQGSTFIVSLPVTVLHSEAVEPQTPREHPATHVPMDARRSACDQLAGVSVVAVDDEADAVAMIKRLLTECGATVRTATNAQDAIALIRADQPSVLVSDIGMPGEDGYYLIRRVRSLPGRENSICALALTAYARTVDRVKALEAGFQMHLAKPVEPAELIITVAALSKLTPQQSLKQFES